MTEDGGQKTEKEMENKAKLIPDDRGRRTEDGKKWKTKPIMLSYKLRRTCTIDEVISG